MAELIIFVVGLLLILAASWRPLRDPRQHGFYRFFAFLGILFLVVTNAHVWFRDPFSLLQLISWLLLISSAGLAGYGFHLLRSVGRPEGAFENTTTVVREGAYRHIRHPLYSSLLLFAAGAYLKDPLLNGTILLALVAICLAATARVEEQENLTRFGEPYAGYMKSTKMFVPWLW